MFSFKSAMIALATVTTALTSAAAESHTVRFVNNCGRGTPKLVQNGRVLNSGSTYTSNGPLEAAIAYLDTGCGGINGDNCLITELTLKNNAVSSVDNSLIPQHKFVVPTKFAYTGGCNGSSTCTGAGCCPTNAFCKPSDTQAQRQCQVNDAGLVITYC